MENDFKQCVIIGTIVMGIFVSIYMIQIERKAAVADRKYTEWIGSNQLSEFAHLFFEEDVSYLDALVHFDIDQAKSFQKLSSYGKARIKDALDKLKQETVLKTWLRTKGLAEDYIDRLRVIGVENIWRLSVLSDSQLQALTGHDGSFEDFRDFKRGVAALKNSKLRDVQREMLIHHQSDIVTPGSYSLLTFLLMVLTTLLLIGVTFCIMLILRAQQIGSMFNFGSMFNLSTLSKKSLYFLSGQYDVAQHTKVTWNWEEPQTVGKMMTFSIRFFHKNGKPYPVSNKDNITVEISHGGSEVTKAMTLGGSKVDEVNLAQVSFTVHKSGDYTVCVMFSSRHIKGSPFTKKFEAEL